jgi:hypothetical protein
LAVTPKRGAIGCISERSTRTSAIRLASEGGEAKAGAFAYAPCERQLKVLTLNYLDFCLKNCIQYC